MMGRRITGSTFRFKRITIPPRPCGRDALYRNVIGSIPKSIGCALLEPERCESQAFALLPVRRAGWYAFVSPVISQEPARVVRRLTTTSRRPRHETAEPRHHAHRS